MQPPSFFLVQPYIGRHYRASLITPYGRLLFTLIMFVINIIVYYNDVMMVSCRDNENHFNQHKSDAHVSSIHSDAVALYIENQTSVRAMC